MNKLIVAILFILLSGTNLKSQVIHDVIQKYFSLHNNFKSESDVWGNYTLDLTIESIIHHSRLSEDTYYHDDIKNFSAKGITSSQIPSAIGKHLLPRSILLITCQEKEKPMMNMVFKLSSMP